MALLDPALELEVQNAKQGQSRRKQLTVMFEWPETAAELEQKNLRVLHFEDGFALVSLSTNDIETLRGLENVDHVEMANPLQPELDYSRTVVAAPPDHDDAAIGTGVTIGIVDVGFDVTHESFRNADGTTRFHSIWDMTSDCTDNDRDRGLAPPPDGRNGIEYTAEIINRYLAASILDPREWRFIYYMRGNFRHLAADHHGVHVSGIAAGSGRPDDPAIYRGIAPGAALIGVIGGAAEALPACATYIQETANRLTGSEQAPIVINYSAGSNEAGPHDGSALFAKALSAHIKRTKAIICKSIGNLGDDEVSLAGKTRKAKPSEFRLNILEDVSSEYPLAHVFGFDVWYNYKSQGDKFLFEIEIPEIDKVLGLRFEQSIAFRTFGDYALSLQHFKPKNSTASGIRVRIKPMLGDLSPRSWLCRLRVPDDGIGTGGDAGNWFAWTHRAIYRGGRVSLTMDSGSLATPPSFTEPASAKGLVTVGSFVTKKKEGTTVPNGPLSTFSSRGPILNGSSIPTLSAPGENIWSSVPDTSYFWEKSKYFGSMRGTSMASPHVAGAIALLLEVNPALGPDEVIKILRETATKVDKPNDPANMNSWGSGRLNVTAAIAAAKAG